MKKIVLALIVLLFATPAWADVDITAAQVGDTNEVIISFVNSDLDTNVRAFGLNIQLDNDANILEATGLSADYYIYPGTIQIDAEGLVTYEGSIAAEYLDLPSDTLEGPVDGNGVTLEAASLYAPPGLGSPNEPLRFGDLASIIVSKSCTLCITANVSRAGTEGVVMEDPDEAVTVTYPSVCLDVVIADEECYTGQPDYEEWDTMGKPECWCYPRQCHGDADGLEEGTFIKKWVSMNDLSILVANWQDAQGTAPEFLCADFDHLEEGTFIKKRTSMNDLSILVANWQDALGSLPDCLD